MKKVLIICALFPPSQYIGVIRPYKLAKYFPQFGWQPIILTSKVPGDRPKGFRIIETDSRNIVESLKLKLLKAKQGFIKQLSITMNTTPSGVNHSTWKSNIIKLLKEIVYFPDDRRGWYKCALNSAREFLATEKVDALISTSPSVISHLIANKIKQEHKIPWIADFRDLWTQNHYYDKCAFIRYLENKLESRTISHADAFVTVTIPLVNILKKCYKDKKIFCITNGFDDDDFSRISTKLTDKFTITYTGGLYNGKRNPSLLFQVVKRLIDSKKIKREVLEIRFFGADQNWLHSEIDKYDLKDVVKMYGFVPREDALKFQKESQILLLLLWNNKNDEGIYTGKLFEYLASKRPIIALGGSGGIIKELLEKTAAGKFADHIDTLENILLQFYHEFIQTGELKCTSNNTILNYNYESITKKYSEILDELFLKN